MKNLFAISSALIVSLSFGSANAQSRYSEASFAETMRKMQEARTCSQVYAPLLDDYSAKEADINATVKSLCATGSQDEAVSEYKSFVEQMRADNKIKAAVECAQLIRWSNGLKSVSNPILEEAPDYSKVCG